VDLPHLWATEHEHADLYEVPLGADFGDGLMAGPLQAIKQFDFSKGENVVTSPYLLRPDQAAQALNVILDEHGSLRVRDGTLVQGSASPNAARPIVKIYDFVKNDGTITPLAILAGSTSPLINSLYLRSTNPWTKIGDFTTYSLIPDILTFTNLAILANSNNDPLRSYDGTTFVALTGGPNGQHVANHLNFLWAWNTNPSTLAAAGPSSLQSSDLNNANSWPGANQTFIAKDDGQSGQGLAQYTIAEAGISPTATLIAWKDFTGYECTNPFGASFSVQKIKSDMGCVAPRTIQFISGFGVIRLTHRGFALYDGVNDTLISEEERPRIFGRDAFTGLDWTQIGHSVAAQCANPPLYLCACPQSGPMLTVIFVYDLVRRAWSVLNFPHALATLQLVLDAGALPVVLGGDWNAGFVRRYFAGDTQDEAVEGYGMQPYGTSGYGGITQPVTWLLRTRAYTLGSPSESAYWRRMVLKAYGFPVGSKITATFYYGPTSVIPQSTVTKTIQSITQTSPFTGFGLDPFGTSAFSASSATVTDQDLEFAIGAIANNVQVQLSGSGAGRIRGLELHARQKALTKSTAVGAL
jgi:hypothetical protein